MMQNKNAQFGKGHNSKEPGRINRFDLTGYHSASPWLRCRFQAFASLYPYLSVSVVVLVVRPGVVKQQQLRGVSGRHPVQQGHLGKKKRNQSQQKYKDYVKVIFPRLCGGDSKCSSGLLSGFLCEGHCEP